MRIIGANGDASFGASDGKKPSFGVNRSFAAAGRVLAQIPIDEPYLNDKGMNRLMLAAQIGDINEVRELLDKGADPNHENLVDGLTPLHYAIRGSNREYHSYNPGLAKLLIQRGALVQQSHLDLAVRCDETGEVTRELSDKKYWLNLSKIFDSKSNQSLVMQAYQQRLYKSAEALLEAGADPKHRDKFGRSISYYAAAAPEAFRTAISFIDDYQANILDLGNAVIHGNLETVTWLLDQGLDFDQFNDKGPGTALMYALFSLANAMEGKPFYKEELITVENMLKILKLLIEHGAAKTFDYTVKPRPDPKSHYSARTEYENHSLLFADASNPLVRAILATDSVEQYLLDNGFDLEKHPI